MPTNLEQTILRNLLTDEKYMRKVLPFIKPDYFQGVYKTLFKEAGKYVAKYNKLPTTETLTIESLIKDFSSSLIMEDVKTLLKK